MPPLVMDVFSLDVMTEMLDSPLHFMNYINKRVLYHERIFAERELTILSYHLTHNLWLEDDDESSHISLSDDLAVDLDIAMLARRDNAPASDTPKGILTEYKNTFFDFIIKDIERMENPSTIELGFFLLSISGDTIDYLNNGIQKLLTLHSHDNKHHDLSIILSNNQAGLTIHCNPYKGSDAAAFLEKHCEIKKYQSKSNLWFGLSINPNNGKVRFGCNLNYQWQSSEQMEIIAKSFLSPKSIEFNKNIYGKKIGRNEKCPCGSGKKYKKCCLVD